MSVSEESFLASKSMVLIVIGIASVILVFGMGILADILWKQNVFTYVAAAISGITAHTTGGIARNIMTDTPVRQVEAMPTPAPIQAPISAPTTKPF